MGGDKGGVRLFHVDGTLVHKRPKAHAAQVFALTATPDGAHVVSGSFDQRIKVWSVASRGLVGSCDGHTAAVWAVAALADGERLLSGSADKTVRVWRLPGDVSVATACRCSDDALAAYEQAPKTEEKDESPQWEGDEDVEAENEGDYDEDDEGEDEEMGI